MYSLILRYDLIREKCIFFNEETQIIFGGIVMNKIFTWLFGTITGILTGVLIVGYAVVAAPECFVDVVNGIIKQKE